MSTLAEHVTQLREAEKVEGIQGKNWQVLACVTIAAHLDQIESAVQDAYRYRFLREDFAGEILDAVLGHEYNQYGDPKAQLDEWCGP